MTDFEYAAIVHFPALLPSESAYLFLADFPTSENLIKWHIHLRAEASVASDTSWPFVTRKRFRYKRSPAWRHVSSGLLSRYCVIYVFVK